MLQVSGMCAHGGLDQIRVWAVQGTVSCQTVTEYKFHDIEEAN